MTTMSTLFALAIPIHHDVVGQFREARLVDDLEAGRRESFARVEGRRYLVRDQEILLDQRFHECFRRQMPALELDAEPQGVLDQLGSLAVLE